MLSVQGLLMMDMNHTAASLAAGFAATQIGVTAAAVTGKSVTELAATSVVIAQGNYYYVLITSLCTDQCCGIPTTY